MEISIRDFKTDFEFVDNVNTYALPDRNRLLTIALDFICYPCARNGLVE